MDIVIVVLQVIVALGLLNVWLVRAKKPTPFRGGEAKTIRDEFDTYGLPSFMMYLVGGLKVIVAIAMVVGIWLHDLVWPAAAVLILLMIGAFAMHLKVKDPWTKSVPSLIMLAMAIAIAVFR
jgi:uncharacterized membrane protein YphA (DoxX/SURF4 family)